MPIKNVVVNCTDVQRSVEYYTKFLELRLIGEATPDSAFLDAVTASKRALSGVASPISRSSRNLV